MIPLQHIMLLQGQLCFFCNRTIPQGEASLDHLMPKLLGGSDRSDNLVACCRTLNALFGHMSLKEKINTILKQNGKFTCPNQPKPHNGNQPAPPSQPARTLPPSAPKTVTQGFPDPAPSAKREVADFISPATNRGSSGEC